MGDALPPDPASCGEGFAFPFTPLLRFKFAGQGYSVFVLLCVEECSNQIGDFRKAGRVFFKQLPDEWLGFGQLIGSQQSLGIDIANLSRVRPCAHLRLKNKNHSASLVLCQQNSAVNQSNVWVRRIFSVSALIPLGGVATAGVGQLSQLKEGRGGLFVFSDFRTQFAQACEIFFAGI